MRQVVCPQCGRTDVQPIKGSARATRNGGVAEIVTGFSCACGHRWPADVPPGIELDELKSQYNDVRERAKRFCEAFAKELSRLLDDQSIALGVPLERRVKEWKSIAEKIRRKSIALSRIEELDDLVGVRPILLFKRDVEKVSKLIEDNFYVLSRENPGERLQQTQFGYQSLHYLVQVKDEWLSMPSWKEFAGLTVEVQLRTLAQHVWAEVSHKLQYKQETGVPPSIRRAIHRLSAVLEIVDSELDRVVEEKNEYLAIADPYEHDVPLNVDLLAVFLDKVLPVENKDRHEAYAELLADLARNGIVSLAQLDALVSDFREQAFRHEAKYVSDIAAGNGDYEVDPERQRRGVFLTHAGLIHTMLLIRLHMREWGEILEP